jgi:hypothetical protein
MMVLFPEPGAYRNVLATAVCDADDAERMARILDACARVVGSDAAFKRSAFRTLIQIVCAQNVVIAPENVDLDAERAADRPPPVCAVTGSTKNIINLVVTAVYALPNGDIVCAAAGRDSAFAALAADSGFRVPVTATVACLLMSIHALAVAAGKRVALSAAADPDEACALSGFLSPEWMTVHETACMGMLCAA